MGLVWYKDALHKALPYSIDFGRDHRDLYVYSGGFDRNLKVYLPKKDKIAKSIDLDKEFAKAPDDYLKM